MGRAHLLPSPGGIVPAGVGRHKTRWKRQTNGDGYVPLGHSAAHPRFTQVVHGTDLSHLILSLLHSAHAISPLTKNQMGCVSTMKRKKGDAPSSSFGLGGWPELSSERLERLLLPPIPP
jgi:hypothetical protein